MSAPRASDPGFDGGGCSNGEAFALRVLGTEMAPEFDDGDIVVIEPDGALHDGSFVLAELPGVGWVLRRLAGGAHEGWRLEALAPTADTLAACVPLESLSAVRGVVIQKSVPGRRRLTRRYV